MTFNVVLKRATALAFLAICVGAQADELELIGSVTGVFDNGLTTIGGLHYSGSTFDVTTSGGFYALGNNASLSNFDNLGSFTLLDNAYNYTADTFTLDVTFTSPTGIVGGNSSTYTATLFGSVSHTDKGGVQIEFTNTTKDFTFIDGLDFGSFSLTVNPVSITPGRLDPITGYGTGEQQSVPEPAAMACMFTGLIGVGLRRRRAR